MESEIIFFGKGAMANILCLHARKWQIDILGNQRIL